MCFLYRQSISIVYESKFKYIYRYFIKIDRCFCGILQSLPLRKCGLKYLQSFYSTAPSQSLPLRKCGLKCLSFDKMTYPQWSLPLRKCGLKFGKIIPCSLSVVSLPLRKCGLKFYKKYSVHVHNASLPLRKCGLKSICPFIHTAQPIVTSLAEVWIEIPTAPPSSSGSWSLPLRKCGLKSYTCGCIT